MQKDLLFQHKSVGSIDSALRVETVAVHREVDGFVDEVVFIND